MAKFGFLGLGRKRENASQSGRGPDIGSDLAQDAAATVGPSMAGAEAIAVRTSALRLRLHKHLLSTSRDYAALSAIKASKIAYCDPVTQEVTRRLTGNPFFEVLQNLDDACALIKVPNASNGTRTLP